MHSWCEIGFCSFFQVLPILRAQIYSVKSSIFSEVISIPACVSSLLTRLSFILFLLLSGIHCVIPVCLCVHQSADLCTADCLMHSPLSPFPPSLRLFPSLPLESCHETRAAVVTVTIGATLHHHHHHCHHATQTPSLITAHRLMKF